MFDERGLCARARICGARASADNESARMPRYFFHVSGVATFDDPVGVDLRDDAAAWSMAVVSCVELLKDLGGRTVRRFG